jgi:enoyl-CoA hydratase/carnithine racemase
MRRAPAWQAGSGCGANRGDVTTLRWETQGSVLTLTIDRPERKNPLTFEAYSELRDRFRSLASDAHCKAILITGAGDNFCSGGDVREIIGPLLESTPEELRAFTQMTGDVVKAMRACPQPIVAAIDGTCAGAGAALAMASDLRYGTARMQVAFLFVRVGLAGCDMGACAMLPRIIGLGRAAELLYTGRAMSGDEAQACGFINALFDPKELRKEAWDVAASLAAGPTRAIAMTKKMLHEEWAMQLDDAIDAEASAQAECMQSNDFKRAYEAFVNKRAPVFQGD